MSLNCCEARTPWRLLPCLGVLMLMMSQAVASAEELSVAMANHSYTTQCAEYDNVYVTMQHPAVRQFEIAARHPAYIATLQTDDSPADFRTCDFSGDAVHPFVPAFSTLFQDERTIVEGYTSPSNWRPEKIGIAIGGTTTPDLHLVKVFQNLAGEWVEILVVYPADGYWRIKPLPPVRWDTTTYGSSFLVGPVEEDGRPLVRFSRLAFDPASRTFTFGFARGGSGSLQIVAMDREELRVRVSLDAKAVSERPFAALRSMHISRGNSDAAEAHWRVAGEAAWRMGDILKMPEMTAVAARFGRSIPSGHNTSAPDMTFERFAN
jgi:hypothetical protein